MKWVPKSYVETIIPLTTVYALIGHGVFHYPPGKPRLLFSIFYSFTFFIGFTILLHYTISNVTGYNYNVTEEKLFAYMVYWHTFIINCTGALSWYHYKKSAQIVKRMEAIDETLRELGADCQYLRCFRWNFAALAGQLILVVLMDGVDMIWMKKEKSYGKIVWFIFVTHLPFHVSSYALLNFSMSVRQIVHRFSETNKILEALNKDGSATTAFMRQKKSQVGKANSNADERLVPSNDKGKYLVQIIKQVHLELCCISRDLNQVYGVQVVLQIAEYFILLTASIYDLYLNFTIPGLPDRETMIGVLLCWLTICLARVGAVNHLCGKAIFEFNRTSGIIHISSAKCADPEFKDEVSQFAFQMMQGPLSFTPAGLFTLNNAFFKAMLGSISTYAVILIEMNVASKL